MSGIGLPDLARKSVFILDFDGPVCSVFAGLSPSQLAEQMVSTARSYLTVPEFVSKESDPMEVLRWSATTGSLALVHALDSQLRRGEFEAVKSATMTVGFVRWLEAVVRLGARLAIASNNSAGCIEAWLADHGLSDRFETVSGRPVDRPDLMKPAPFILATALDELAVSASEAAFIGDSLSDIEVGQLVGVETIALANKPGKLALFEAAKPAAVLTSWEPLIQLVGPESC